MIAFLIFGLFSFLNHILIKCPIYWPIPSPLCPGAVPQAEGTVAVGTEGCRPGWALHREQSMLCARQGWAQQKRKRNQVWAWGSLWQALPTGGLLSGELLPANYWRCDPACCSGLPWGHVWVNAWQRTAKIIHCGSFLPAPPGSAWWLGPGWAEVVSPCPPLSLSPSLSLSPLLLHCNSPAGHSAPARWRRLCHTGLLSSQTDIRRNLYLKFSL